jgi:hypothetical protein
MTTTSTNHIGHLVRVTGISGTWDIDTRQNVKKRFELFRFNQSIPDGDVNITYAAAEPVYADNNLFLSDKSTSINENSPNFLIEEQVFYGFTYNTFFKNFLLTDVFTSATTTRPAEPLYFRHTLAAAIDENSVKVLDKNFNPIDGYLYTIEKPLDYNDDDDLPMDGSDIDHPIMYQGVYIYNNLENVYDAQTGEYTVYYVSYAENSGNVINELLDNTPVFHEAEFDDISQVTSLLKIWVKAYQIEEIDGVFTVTVPTNNLYAFKSLDTARIFVQEPLDKESELPWFLRISNGAFKYIKGTETYIYNLPEFMSQNFIPVFPYKFVIAEETQRISEHLVALRRGNIKLDAVNNYYIDIEIFDQQDDLLYALTTDLSKIDTNYIDNMGEMTAILWTSDLIDSIDRRKGFLYLSPVLKDTYKIFTTYYFEEKDYEFTQVNFNPTQNNNILNERIVLYLVPENFTNNNNIGHATALHYLRVSPEGLITYTSQDSTSQNEDLKTGTTYMIEGADRKSTTPGGISHIFWVKSPEIYMGMYYDAIPDSLPNMVSPETFVDTFTVNAADGKPGLDKRYLVLAELFVNEHTAPEVTTLLDTRVLGGGIKKNRIPEALIRNPEVQWYNDIGNFDGRPYPGTSVVIIKIPYTILNEYGGLLSRKQVKQIAKRHLALGSEPIIRYYGVIPNFTSIIAADEAVVVTWDSEGSDYEYNIYYSTEKQGPYIKHSASPITDNPSGNTLVIDGLTNKIAVYVTGTAVNRFTDLEGPRAVAIIGRPELIIRA